MTNFLDQLPKHIREIAEQGKSFGVPTTLFKSQLTSCTPVNVLAPEEVLTTPKVRFLDTRQQSLHTIVRKCTPDDVRVLKDAAAKWLAEMPQSGDSQTNV